MGELSTAPGVISVANNSPVGAEEVMKYLGCKENKAYSIIRSLKKELVDAGKLTPEYPIGKIPRKYFMERCMIGQ